MSQGWRRWVILILIVLAVAAYHLPWHTHPAAAFSNNGFDLAEFVSLHPHIRAESPTLYTSLLLRLPLLLLALMIVLTAEGLVSERARWLWRGVAVLFVLRLNPPAIFYPYGGGSENDQQLGNMMIAGLIIVFAAIAAGRWFKRVYHPLMLVILGVMLPTARNGYQRATDLIRDGLLVEVKMGGGFVLFLGFSIAAALFVLFDGWQAYRNRQGGEIN